MRVMTTDVGSYKIRSIEHQHWYVRIGGEFVLTLTRGSWGIEICRNRSQDWAGYGVVTRFLGARISGLWFQVFFGSVGGYIPPQWIARRNSWLCLVTSKDLWPDIVE